jgi:hypothetical protein
MNRIAFTSFLLACFTAYAHKPWLLKHDGVVYHFYCAVGNQGRVIALATSRPMKESGR